MKTLLITLLLVSVAVPALAGVIIRPGQSPIITDYNQKTGNVFMLDPGSGQVTTGNIDRYGNGTLVQTPGYQPYVPMPVPQPPCYGTPYHPAWDD